MNFIGESLGVPLSHIISASILERQKNEPTIFRPGELIQKEREIFSILHGSGTPTEAIIVTDLLHAALDSESSDYSDTRLAIIAENAAFLVKQLDEKAVPEAYVAPIRTTTERAIATLVAQTPNDFAIHPWIRMLEKNATSPLVETAYGLSGHGEPGKTLGMRLTNYLFAKKLVSTFDENYNVDAYELMQSTQLPAHTSSRSGESIAIADVVYTFLYYTHEDVVKDIRNHVVLQGNDTRKINFIPWSMHALDLALRQKLNVDTGITLVNRQKIPSVDSFFF